MCLQWSGLATIAIELLCQELLALSSKEGQSASLMATQVTTLALVTKMRRGMLSAAFGSAEVGE